MKKILIAGFTFLILVGGFLYWQQNKISVSVIIPVYNAEKYLARCLDSILIQKGEFEIIAVNDGSTDSSLQILKKYAEKHPNLRVIDQKNQGVAGARNTGISHARYKYITFVDNDDWIEPDTFELAFKYLKKDKPDILLTGFYDVYDREWVRQTRGEEAAKEVPNESKYQNHSMDKLVLFSPFYVNDAYSDLFYEGGGVRVRFYLREFVNKYNISFNDGIGEDTSFIFKAYTHNPFISVMNIPVYNYRNRADSVSKSARVLKESIDTLKKFQQSDEYKNANRRMKMFITDNWLGITLVGVANLQRHGAPAGTGVYELNDALKLFNGYNKEELKAARNYQRIKNYLKQIGFNPAL